MTQSVSDLEEYVERRVRQALRRQAARELGTQLAEFERDAPLPLGRFLIVLVVVLVVLAGLVAAGLYLVRIALR
jgi:hypothetical protein